MKDVSQQLNKILIQSAHDSILSNLTNYMKCDFNRTRVISPLPNHRHK